MNFKDYDFHSEAIATEGLSVSYGTQSVLKNVDLSIASGEIISLIGRSGSGKTSLLKVIAGLLRSRSRLVEVTGRVQVFGREPKDAVSEGLLAFAFQEPALLPWLSAEANSAWLMKMREGRVDNRAVSGLWHLLDLSDSDRPKTPRKMSGGERQRVSLARALALTTKLYLLDEPLSAVDYLRRRRILAGLRDRLKHNGSTCLYVTHDIPDAVHFADRIIYTSSKRRSFNEDFVIQLPTDRSPGIREMKAFTNAVRFLIEELERAEC